MTYLISYDIRSPGNNYASLLNTIALFPNHRRVLRSCWFVESELSAAAIHDILTAYIDQNDRLLVCRITGFAASNLILNN